MQSDIIRYSLTRKAWIKTVLFLACSLLPATLCPNPSAVLAVIFIEEVLYRVGFSGCYTIINLLKRIAMNTRYKDYDLDSRPAKSS